MDKDKAIRNKYPTVVSINVSDSVTQAWDKDGNVVELNNSLITQEMDKLQTEYNAQDYARKRANEYPSIADQLDDIYHNGIDAWKATIKTTKDKHQKG
jgi:hypothetical protein|tara:strand:- start:689 stop:982 length:294 start_codon:yes stop_codon:yes gene_type:complete